MGCFSIYVADLSRHQQQYGRDPTFGTDALHGVQWWQTQQQQLWLCQCWAQNLVQSSGRAVVLGPILLTAEAHEAGGRTGHELSGSHFLFRFW